MTDIKYKDDNGWNTYQNMVGIRMTIRKMRLDMEKEKDEITYKISIPTIIEVSEDFVYSPTDEDIVGCSRFELGCI